MTAISHAYAPAARTARSPLAVVTDAVGRLLRSYSDTLAKDTFLVPNGRMAYAARQAS